MYNTTKFEHFYGTVTTDVLLNTQYKFFLV